MTTLFLVYLTNGTQHGYLHFIYVPIMFSGYFWGKIGGASFALVSGLLLGPFMPLDVANGIMQETSNWSFRVFILITIGYFIGFLFDKLRRMNDESRKKDFISPLTGIYNTNKLFFDLENAINAKNNFNLIALKLKNIVEIEKYLDYDLMVDIFNDVIKELEVISDKEGIYSSRNDELFILIYSDFLEYKNKINKIIEKYSEFFTIKNYDLRIAIKAGIYEHKGETNNPVEIYNKARIAFDQRKEKSLKVYYFDANLEKEKKKYYEITFDLLNAIDKNELYVLYQPKIDIQNNTIIGVEALVRWNRGEKESVGPNIFIKIAEKVGFISNIDKHVFKIATTQILKWQDKGINIKCAINITAEELLDKNLIEWENKVINSKNIDRSNIEIEITERIVSYQNKDLINILKSIREKGYIVSIDDFGTGYNSLMSIGEMPFDILKIDKYFIDKLDEYKIQLLVERIIDCAHKLNKIVVAEGVETKEQLNILKEMNCDCVQGYYYSKPLSPSEFEKLYHEFRS